jgi:hypothetical protein
MKLFGWEFKKADEPPVESFSPELKDDGAVVVAAGGSYGTYVDLEGTSRSEAELITRYREMSMQPEVEAAVDDIVNDAIIVDEDYIVRIVLDNVKIVSPNIKKMIENEFRNILELLDFNRHGYEIFKRWYVDGRIYYHVIIDEKAPRLGIQELRYIDPRKMRKIREVKRERKDGFTVAVTKDEYFMYSEKGFLVGSTAGTAADYTAAAGLKISTDSVLYVTSGLTDQNNAMVLSYLHKAIRPLNQLRVLEDSTVIYRISRAPERRIFYIDVGNLPKVKAEQYVRDMMVKHKNRLIYDQTTGEVKDDRKFITMLEDYWLPRREGNKGTEIQTLPSGTNLGELTDVMYFQKKLYKALYVPVTRIDPETPFVLATEISRDELKFNKFVSRLRSRFAELFNRALEKQLLLKAIISPDEWDVISKQIIYDFHRDNHFTELKDNEVMTKRVGLAQMLEPYVGRYYSNDYIRRNIFKQDDDDIEQQDELIAEEQGSLIYNPPQPQDVTPGVEPTVETGAPMPNVKNTAT